MVTVEIKREVIEGLLSYAAYAHPREAILLLRGKARKDAILIEELIVPPLATHGQGFASFHSNMLPIDFSIVGVAHSHPSGHRDPSTGDLNRIYGRLMTIAAHPYRSKEDVAVYDREGERIEYQVIP